jgi:hypothetical protein
MVDIIVTSRSKTVQDIATLGDLNVGEMDRGQAVELFYKASKLTTLSLETEEEVKRIVDKLGCLALAVNLAGTYVRETPRLRSNVSRYLVEYRQRRPELLQRKPTRQGHQYSESVLTTWEASFYAMQEQYPAAANLLTVLAFLSYDDIYLDLFGLDGATTHKEYGDDDIGRHKASWKTWVSSGEQINLYMIEECFRLLKRYCLVEWQGDQESYTMHRLVHAWGHERLPEDQQRELSRASFQLVVEAINVCGNAPEDKLRVVPHVMANFTASHRIERASRSNAVLL